MNVNEPSQPDADINPQNPEERNALFNQKETELQQALWENQELKKNLSKRDEAEVQLENAQSHIQDLTKWIDFLEEKRSDSNDQPSLTEVSFRFSQIYYHEWRDAFKNIPSEIEEEKRIGALYTIVMRAFAFCENKMKDLNRSTGADLYRKDDDAHRPQAETAPVKLPKQLDDQLKKKNPGKTTKQVEEEFMTTFLASFMYGAGITSENAKSSLQSYASKCAKICWLLLACNSKVSLSSAKVDTQFDRNLSIPYTKRLSESGQSAVEFFVWPALLHGTDVLARGVAQPKTLEQRNP